MLRVGGIGATVVKHTRTLSNVEATGTYKSRSQLSQNTLSFSKNEKNSYSLTFTESGPPPVSGFGFGSLEWSNKKNVVRSPISIIWNSGRG
ncbi:Subtilisin-like protease SBT1.7, partial [Mucuna pruriens]